MVEDIVSLTERLALAGPVVLVLDDLQWADPSTLTALHALTQRDRTFGCSWAATASRRPPPLEVRAIGTSVRLTLRPSKAANRG